MGLVPTVELIMMSDDSACTKCSGLYQQKTRTLQGCLDNFHRRVSPSLVEVGSGYRIEGD